MIPLRIYAYLAVALAIAGLAWRYHYVTSALKRSRAEAAQLQADYGALQAAYAHEQQIATEASNDYERRLADYEAAKADTPVRSVRLCRSPTGYVPAPAPAAAGAGPARDGGLSQEHGRDSEEGPDIGPQLYALADRANIAAAKCNALMKWAGSR